ncbi:Protein of unknown function (DUF630) Protein of unknown function (DUF632) [Melia azedarach]|uniref:Uncharacterized protein n=1 Tax=Melia azedarach TaxID=155640 RepID=A0ACC1XRP6_MELAZ|nr:Protein of unknown function (DUF630) Protein of unknown function (DUF632) [Melia azedarach]
MGCWYSRVDREENVSRCKARKKYMKQLVKARQAFSASHAMYLRSLRSTGAALLQFSANETVLHRQCYRPPPQPRTLPSPLPPPPRPPFSPSTETWTSSTMASPLPPPPPPPPATSSNWDFWDPFVPASSMSVTEEEWEDEEIATTVSDVAMTRAESVMAPPSSVVTSASTELAIVSRNSKDLGEIVKEVDDYFLKAADAGAELSAILEVSSSGFSADSKGVNKIYSYGCTLNPTSWTWGSTPAPRMNTHRVRIGQMDENNVSAGGIINDSHHCTVERLYAWEKKLFLEVKNCETVKKEHEKRVGQLRKMDVKRADYFKTEKVKKEVEKLESQMIVASQAIETISAEIIKVRETQLYPQLLELVKGMMCMWRSMYESHQVQMHIVQQLKYLNTIPSSEPTSEIHRQSTLQLELQVQQWQQSFCDLVQAQQNYIQSLTGWLRLSLFQFSKSPLSKENHESGIYSLCEEWQQAVDRTPDKVAAEGIKSFLSVVHAIVLQQAEEHKQKKKSESAFKEYEKKVSELRSLESKYGPFSTPESSHKDLVGEKRAKVEMLKRKAEEEKTKYDKFVGVTRAMTMNNLQMGFPHVFQAMVGFSSVCMQSFETVYIEAKQICQEQDVKRILP